MLDPRRPHHSIQLRSLRLFCEVVRKKNFSAAATEYGLTQGAASQAVQHLEDLVDVQLLDRSTRPFVLTAEGQKFYEGISEFLRGFDTLLDEVRGKAGDISGYISVASIYSIGLSYLPNIEEQFRQRFQMPRSSRIWLIQMKCTVRWNKVPSTSDSFLIQRALVRFLRHLGVKSK